MPIFKISQLPVILVLVVGDLQFFTKNMIHKSLIAISLILTLTSSFSLQGTWTYEDSQAAAGQEDVTLLIEDFIFRGNKIMQKLRFRGCQEMLLQSQFS